jgi:porphobilinogen synthase
MEEEKYFINQKRLRANKHIREISSGINLSYKEFIQPIFVDEALTERKESKFLTGVYTETTDSLLKQIEADLNKGVSKFILFPIPNSKTDSEFDFSFAANIIRELKLVFGSSIWLASDLCLCSYTNHGHCGILSSDGSEILNSATINTLSAYALEIAQAGADCIAPSDMTDGRIAAIRNALNFNGFEDVAIMSYSSKFSSFFYGPFRDVCKSFPSQHIQLKERNTYQIDSRNLKDALASSIRDIKEGADLIMVKPCLPYLDVIKSLSELNVPLVAYQVSGEYAAIELLAKNGLTKRANAHLETWIAAKRSGSNAIISYAARNAKEWIDLL